MCAHTYTRVHAHTTDSTEPSQKRRYPVTMGTSGAKTCVFSTIPRKEPRLPGQMPGSGKGIEEQTGPHTLVSHGGSSELLMLCQKGSGAIRKELPGTI